MCRSEAKGVPNLLVAPAPVTERSGEEGLYDDYPLGYYADGAYTAVPLPSSNINRSHDEGSEDLDPQEAYYRVLCARFSKISSTLHPSPPPPETIPEPPLSFTSKQWRYRLLKILPKPTQLAQLPQENVIRALDILEDVLTSGNLKAAHGKNVGAWAWGLLARCREVGQMGSEEVGVVRKLGKKAVWLLRRMAAGEVMDEDQEGEEEEEENEEEAKDGPGEDRRSESDASCQTDIDPISIESDITTTDPPLQPPHSPGSEPSDPLAAARQRLLSSLHSPDTHPSDSPHDNTTPHPTIETTTTDKDPTPTITAKHHSTSSQSREGQGLIDKDGIYATLDMIVTVVGEFYGQKDLLAGRLLWDEMS